MALKLKTNFSKTQQKRVTTGYILLIVGICAMLVGWFAPADAFWRGATFGVGLSAVVVSLSYLYPKHIQSK